MHDAAWLSQAAILFGAAIATAWVFRFFKAPAVIGYLIAGVLIGPSSLGLIDHAQVEQFAEIGLVLLLFTVGLELSPGPLLQTGPRLFVVTSLQIGTTTAAAAFVLISLGGLNAMAASVLGLGVALSSTAIVLKTLGERRELQTSMGNLCTGVLLLQDMCVIIVMLLLPLFAPAEAQGHTGGVLRTLLGFVALAAIIVAARFALPRVLNEITRSGGSELMALFAVTMAAGGAWLAGAMGWPLPLGACAAGLLLAEADVRHQLAAEIAPFRDVFNALFFISLGMLVDTSLVLSHLPLLLLAIAAALIVKTALTGGAAAVAGWPVRVALQAGLGLCTVSEFAYVLAREAAGMGLLPAATLDLLIPFAVGTMLAGAMIIPLSATIAERLTLGRAREARPVKSKRSGGEFDLSSHVIIVGYGVNGENLTAVLRATHIPFCAIEMNRPRAHLLQAEGVPVVVGDAARASILYEAGLETARALVVAINDPQATQRVVAQARRLRPDLYILARTYSVRELDALYANGANAVIPADFEVSIKIFAHVLTELRIPDNVVQAQIAAVRAGSYSLLRGGAVDQQQNLRELLEVFRLTATQTFYVAEDSPIVGRSIAGLDLRKHSGATIIAIVREGVATASPSAEFEIRFGDVLVLVGSHAQLDAARQVLAPCATDGGRRPVPA